MPCCGKTTLFLKQQPRHGDCCGIDSQLEKIVKKKDDWNERRCLLSDTWPQGGVENAGIVQALHLKGNKFANSMWICVVLITWKRRNKVIIEKES